jgi:hypothetical protein
MPGISAVTHNPDGSLKKVNNTSSAVVNAANNAGRAATSGGSSSGGSSSGGSSSPALTTLKSYDSGVQYDASTNSVVLSSGQTFKVADIASGQVAGLKYSAGTIQITSQASFNNTLAHTEVIGKNWQADKTALQDVINEASLASQIRQNRGKYEQLFSMYGETLTDSDINKLIANTEDATDVWRKVSLMENLQSYFDVHKLYTPDKQFTLDQAKGYKDLYGTPEIMGKTIDAQGKLAAYGVDIKSLFKTYMQKDVSDQNLMDFYMGRETAPSFEKQYQLAVSQREGAMKESQARTPLAWDESNNLILKGPEKSFV